jgi:hypothetical protein
MPNSTDSWTASLAELLTATIRDALGSDAELGDWCKQARERRLHKVAQIRMSKLLCPAAYTAAALATLPELPPAAQWTAGVSDPWPGWLAAHIRRRMMQILAGIFDPLRAGQRQAIGILPASGTPVPVPCELWSAATAAVDMRTGNLMMAGGLTLFACVEVSDPAPRPSRSRASLDQFVTAFDGALAAQGRRYVVGEAVEAARRALGAVSASEVEGAIRRSALAALAGPGRRARHLVPTAGEIDAAAARATETPGITG